MSIIIRKSATSDIPAVYALIQEFAIFQQTPEKVKVTPEQMKEDEEVFQCFVAEDTATGELAGFATIFFAYYSWSGKSLYLDDLYVKEKYRGRHIGTILMNRVIDYAKETNCKKLRWQVSNWNKNAQAFYRKLGALIDDTEVNCDLDLLLRV